MNRRSMINLRDRKFFLIGFLSWIIAGCASAGLDHLSVPSLTDRRLDRVLWEGQNAYKDDHFALAAKIFQDVIANHPGSPYLMEAQWMLGQTYEHQGMWKRALMEYESLLINFPQNPYTVEARLRIEILREAVYHKEKDKDYPVLFGTEILNVRPFALRMRHYRAKGFNTLIVYTDLRGKDEMVKRTMRLISIAHREGFYVLAHVQINPLDLFDQNIQTELKRQFINVAVSGMDGVLFEGLAPVPGERLPKKVMEEFLRHFEIKSNLESILEDPAVYWRWIGWRNREMMRILKDAIDPILKTKTTFYWGMVFPFEAITVPHKAAARWGLDLLEAKRHGVDYFIIRELGRPENYAFIEKVKDQIGDPRRIIMVDHRAQDRRLLSRLPSDYGIFYLRRATMVRVP